MRQSYEIKRKAVIFSRKEETDSRNNRVSGSISQKFAFERENELHNRNLHISGLLNEEKVDIQDEKVNIESVLSEKK